MQLARVFYFWWGAKLDEVPNLAVRVLNPLSPQSLGVLAMVPFDTKTSWHWSLIFTHGRMYHLDPEFGPRPSGVLFCSHNKLCRSPPSTLRMPLCPIANHQKGYSTNGGVHLSCTRTILRFDWSSVTYPFWPMTEMESGGTIFVTGEHVNLSLWKPSN